MVTRFRNCGLLLPANNRRLKNFLVISALLWLAPAEAQKQLREEDRILGVWLTGSGKARVEIYKCGSDYCGRIVWLRDPVYEDGSAKIDKKNEDPKLQSRPVMGLNLLNGFEYDDDLEWDDGEIYDPENGKTYDCVIYMEEDKPDLLEVRGYIGISLIGRSDLWRRFQAD